MCVEENNLILSGKNPSENIQNRVSLYAEKFGNRFGRKPCLAVIIVGEDPASAIYVSRKRKVCDICNISHRDIALPESTGQKELLEIIDSLNTDETVDGILVQQPLPKQIDETAVINSILPEKDVDGFTPTNIGKTLLGEKSIVSCTPKGVLRLLDFYNVDTCGKNVCIVGRSNIVGKPLAALLMQKDRNATVTVCHSKTPDLSFFTKSADILIVAVGSPCLIKSDMVKKGCVIIDVGINRVPSRSNAKGYVIKGDVDYEDVESVASAITPVPGGVGLLTVAELMENTLIAACNHRNIEVSAL